MTDLSDERLLELFRQTLPKSEAPSISDDDLRRYACGACDSAETARLQMAMALDPTLSERFLQIDAETRLVLFLPVSQLRGLTTGDASKLDREVLTDNGWSVSLEIDDAGLLIAMVERQDHGSSAGAVVRCEPSGLWASAIEAGVDEDGIGRLAVLPAPPERECWYVALLKPVSVPQRSTTVPVSMEERHRPRAVPRLRTLRAAAPWLAMAATVVVAVTSVALERRGRDATVNRILADANTVRERVTELQSANSGLQQELVARERRLNELTAQLNVPKPPQAERGVRVATLPFGAISRGGDPGGTDAPATVAIGGAGQTTLLLIPVDAFQLGSFEVVISPLSGGATGLPAFKGRATPTILRGRTGEVAVLVLQLSAGALTPGRTYRADLSQVDASVSRAIDFAVTR